MDAITILCNFIQILLAGYFIGAAVKHFKRDAYFLFGVDIALTMYLFLGLAALRFG